MIVKPRHVNELVGIGDKTISTINSFLHDFQHEVPGHKKAILLHGHQGTGKSTLVECVANDYNFPLLEVNGSAIRTTEALENTVGRYAYLKPRGVKHAIILIDEGDGIYRDAFKTLADLIRKTRNPIFITANNDYPLRQINDLVIKVPFYRHKPSTIDIILRRYTGDEQKIHDIIQNCDGDIRTALNMLDSLAQESFTGTTLFTAIDDILRGKETRGHIDDTNNILLEWLEENAQYRLLGVSHLMAYQQLCNAGRLEKLSSKYMRKMLIENVRLVSGFHVNEFSKALTPSFGIKVRDLKPHVDTVKSLSQKLPFHTRKQFESDVLPILQILSKNQDWLKAIHSQYGLTESEVAMLLNVPIGDIAVTSFMEMVKPGRSNGENKVEFKPVVAVKLRQMNLASV